MAVAQTPNHSAANRPQPEFDVLSCQPDDFYQVAIIDAVPIATADAIAKRSSLTAEVAAQHSLSELGFAVPEEWERVDIDRDQTQETVELPVVNLLANDRRLLSVVAIDRLGPIVAAHYRCAKE